MDIRPVIYLVNCGYKTSYRIYDLISELKQGLNNSEIWNYLQEEYKTYEDRKLHIVKV